MEEFYIGQVFEKDYPPSAARWCNNNGTCHIEERPDGNYEIVENYIINAPDTSITDDGTLSYMEIQELVEEAYLQSQYNAILLDYLMEG